MPSSWLPDASFLPTRQGYFVTKPAVSPDDNGRLAKGANAFVEDSQGRRVGMWVDEVKASFALAGSSAQSAMLRDFYPHNFTQPSLTIHGQTSNNYESNRLSYFIRQAQLDSLRMTRVDEPNQHTLTGLLRFVCVDPDTKARRRNLRGPHRPIDIYGIVASTPHGAERFVTAGEYEFDFIIMRATSFLGLADNVVTTYKLQQTIAERIEAGRPRVAKKTSSSGSDSNDTPQDLRSPDAKDAATTVTPPSPSDYSNIPPDKI